MISNVYILADIHGSFKPIREFYNRNKVRLDGKENVLILLGDAGLNFFFNHRDEEFKKKLGSYPFTYFIIRGNHEERPSICAHKNPDKWDTEEFFDGGVWVEKEYPYIKYAMDFVNIYYIPYRINYFDPENPLDDDIEEIEYCKTLIIPGAYSVDKFYRIEKDWSWFPEEQLSQEEMDDGIKLIAMHDWKCDLVLSHTCPIIYEPTDLFLSTVNQSIVDKTMERYLGGIEYKLDYKLWIFGHYHSTRVYPKNGNKQMLMLFNDKVINLDEWISREFGQWY